MYNPENVVERQGLPQDLILDGVIIALDDRKVKDFVKHVEKWKNAEQQAINITIEVIYEKNTYKFDKVFAYMEEEGRTVFNSKSDLGKFKQKYGVVPKVGVKVKCSTTKEGYLRLKLD